MLNKKLFILLLLLLVPVSSAINITDTLFSSNITNYSIYINETIIMDSATVTDEGRIEFRGIVTEVTIGKMYNTNDTHNSVVDIFGLINALIFYGNGTVLEQAFAGDINISVDIGNNVTVLNNYIIDDTNDPATGDEINQGGGSGATRVDDITLDTLLIQIQNLDRSFIYMSNETTIPYVTENINISLDSMEYFYILDFATILPMNENNGTILHDTGSGTDNAEIFNASWTNDGVFINLTEGVDYVTSGNIFTVVNLIYSWTEIISDFSINVVDINCVIDSEQVEEDFSLFVIGLLGFLGIIGIVLGVLWLVAYISRLFRRDSLGSLGSTS